MNKYLLFLISILAIATSCSDDVINNSSVQYQSNNVELFDSITTQQSWSKMTMKQKLNVFDMAMVQFGKIDDMSLEYNGNQLKKVSDQCDDLTYEGAMEFKDGATKATEYTYDANGNMTKDRNKGIHSITYNMPNLPQIILFNDGHETRYTYAADGRKLRVQYLLNNFAIFDGEEAEDGGEDGAEMMPFSLASTNDFVVGDDSNQTYYLTVIN